MKFENCIYCGDSIEIHHIKLHERQCYLKPQNLSKIVDYCIAGIDDIRLFRCASFYRWARDNNILTSISISKRLGIKRWNHALYQLLIFAWLKGLVDFETTEVILFILSSGSMWTKPEYAYLYSDSIENECKRKGITLDDLHYNYYLLLIAILARTNRDLLLNDRQLDENKKPVDLKDAVYFYKDFAPDLLSRKVNQGQVSDDVYSLLSGVSGV